LGDQVKVILVGEEEGLAEVAHEVGALYLPGVARNDQGTPLVSSIFNLARQHSDSPYLVYVNADVMLLPDVLEAARAAARLAQRFLIVGQRWDLDVREPVDFTPGWDQHFASRVRTQGSLHRPAGSDYFIFPRPCFTAVPDFAIGRAGWDNWMIYEGRRQGWLVLDATPSIMVVHQDHDYSHLPGGQPHYRLPETSENVRLAGGRQVIFTLADVPWRLAGGQLQRNPLTWQRFWREVEIFPLVRLRSSRLSGIITALLHPAQAYWAGRAWLKHKLGLTTRSQRS
jgi:hypothetical protein